MTNPTYFAYLLRIWRDHDQAPWMAMVESAQASERTIFSSLTALVAFLEYRTGEHVQGLTDPLAQDPASGPSLSQCPSGRDRDP